MQPEQNPEREIRIKDYVIEGYPVKPNEIIFLNIKDELTKTEDQDKQRRREEATLRPQAARKPMFDILAREAQVQRLCKEMGIHYHPDAEIARFYDQLAANAAKVLGRSPEPLEGWRAIPRDEVRFPVNRSDLQSINYLESLDPYARPNPESVRPSIPKDARGMPIEDFSGERYIHETTLEDYLGSKARNFPHKIFPRQDRINSFRKQDFSKIEKITFDKNESVFFPDFPFRHQMSMAEVEELRKGLRPDEKLGNDAQVESAARTVLAHPGFISYERLALANFGEYTKLAAGVRWDTVVKNGLATMISVFAVNSVQAADNNYWFGYHPARVSGILQSRNLGASYVSAVVRAPETKKF